MRGREGAKPAISLSGGRTRSQKSSAALAAPASVSSASPASPLAATARTPLPPHLVQSPARAPLLTEQGQGEEGEAKEGHDLALLSNCRLSHGTSNLGIYMQVCGEASYGVTSPPKVGTQGAAQGTTLT